VALRGAGPPRPPPPPLKGPRDPKDKKDGEKLPPPKKEEPAGLPERQGEIRVIPLPPEPLLPSGQKR